MTLAIGSKVRAAGHGGIGVVGKVKERPILFSAPMVRAILTGTKTVTRRIVKDDDAPILVEPHNTPNVTICRADGTPIREWFTLRPEPSARLWWLRPGTRVKPTPGKLKMSRQWDREKRVRGEARWSSDELAGLCPYGLPGDRLWVREAWGLHSRGDETDWERGSVRTATEDDIRSQYELTYRADWGALQESCFWRPGIHMPRWASRIDLEVVSVRVERLHDITEEDARAEGVESCDGLLAAADICAAAKLAGCSAEDARGWFAALWFEINGEESWRANPWVWRVEFKRMEAQP